MDLHLPGFFSILNSAYEITWENAGDFWLFDTKVRSMEYRVTHPYFISPFSIISIITKISHAMFHLCLVEGSSIVTICLSYLKHGYCLT